MGRRKLREVVSVFLSFIHCAPSLRCFCLFVEPVWKADVYYANDSNLSNLQHKMIISWNHYLFVQQTAEVNFTID